MSCPILGNPVDYPVQGILWARILEKVAVPFSRGSSQPRDRTQVSGIASIISWHIWCQDDWRQLWEGDGTYFFVTKPRDPAAVLCFSWSHGNSGPQSFFPQTGGWAGSFCNDLKNITFIAPFIAWKNPMDWGAWWAAVHGVAKSQTRLNDFTFTFHFIAMTTSALPQIIRH